MKKSNQSSQSKNHKQKPDSKGGKRSLYDPKLGASNYRKAQSGRFAGHPAFIACKKMAGAFVGLERITPNSRDVNLRLPAITGQLGEALSGLCDAAKNLKSMSDKLRFAEALTAFFDPPKAPDEKVWRVCWRAIELRTRKHEEPSQAELRQAAAREDGMICSDEEWKRLLKRTGLNKQLPTQREKRRGRFT